MDRSERLDTFRGILIWLVIVGHFTKRYAEDNFICGGLTGFVYAFHMPMFAFVSGFLSGSRQTLHGGNLTRILYPYFVFQFLFIGYRKWLGYTDEWSIFTPTSHLWFLLSLFVWRTCRPYLGDGRLALLLLSILALLAGYSKDSSQSMLTICFFPFFAAGICVSGHTFDEWCKSRFAKVGAIIVVCVALFTALKLGSPQAIGNATVFHVFWKPYSTMGSSAWWPGAAVWGPFIRLGAWGTALIVGSSVYVLMPRKIPGFSKWGRYSMYPYILHEFVVLGFVANVTHATTSWMFVAFLLTLLIPVVSCNDSLRKTLRPLIELPTEQSR